MTEAPRPYTLVAELTYRCPLRCPYCSNSVDHGRHHDALTTEDWARVLHQAEDLGVVQVHFTGGEPLIRQDLEELVRRARSLQLFSSLITSGIPLECPRLEALKRAGLDSVQLSFQGADADTSDKWAGLDSFKRKRAVAGWVKALELPLTVNVVLHRGNLHQIEGVIALAEELGADRLELANAQYVGWALENRQALLPRREDLERAREVAHAARQRLKGRMEVLFVTPDYYSDRPKACMDGWGRRFIVVAPDGLVLPCHAAHTLPGLTFESVRDRPLEEIWLHSHGLNAFRGEAWMSDPCRSCEHRTRDFGGCRCQAFHLAGDAALTDPACSLSPNHRVVTRARAASDANRAPETFMYRSAKGGPSP